MHFPEITIPYSNALALIQFKEMDSYAVEKYSLPIELMMENAGLQLANLIAHYADNTGSRILVGVGNGNNGGGGLVAARRLAAWGYTVYLDIPTVIDKELPKMQLKRALNFGVKNEAIPHPDIWVDAYLGFSQRLPLQNELLKKIQLANICKCFRISLDLPTGFLGDSSTLHFNADKVLTLAASKKILYNLEKNVEIFIADLGIPAEVYAKFGFATLPFSKGNILKLQTLLKDE